MEQTASNKGLKIIIFMLVLVILLLSGYIIYKELFAHRITVESQKNTESKEINTAKTLIATDPIIIEQMSKFEKMGFDEEKTSYSIINITDSELIGIALNNIDDDYINWCYTPDKDLKKINSDKFYEILNDSLSKLVFDKSINSTSFKTVKIRNNYYYPLNTTISVLFENNEVILDGPCDFDDFWVSKKFEKGEIIGDSLYVYVKQAYSAASEYHDYYKEPEMETLLDRKDNGHEEPNWQLFDTYKYTFKLYDGNYYFESYELVKE